MKFVSRFQGIEEYNIQEGSGQREQGAGDWEIKVRIKELLRYRKNRINNLQESQSYEAEGVKRNKGNADRKKTLEACQNQGFK